MSLTRAECCPDAAAYIYRDGACWVLDFDDGMSGLPVHFCPWCGTKLPTMEASDATQIDLDRK